jgi:protein prenyltransferase alpha subunit repeat containing protein 1
MAELLQALNEVFESDPAVDEVDFVISDNAGLLHVEHKLGIPYAVAVRLLAHAHEVFFGWRAKSEIPLRQDLFQVTRALLLINGACTTAWNSRKSALLEDPGATETELRFVALVLTRHPKSSEVWAHRYVTCSYHFLISNIY